MGDDILATHWCNITDDKHIYQYANSKITMHLVDSISSFAAAAPRSNDVYFIDEGHFFEDLVSSVRVLAEKGHNIYIAMLKCNSELQFMP